MVVTTSPVARITTSRADDAIPVTDSPTVGGVSSLGWLFIILTLMLLSIGGIFSYFYYRKLQRMKQDDDLIRDIKVEEYKQKTMQGMDEEDFMTFDSFKQTKERDAKREKVMEKAADEIRVTLSREKSQLKANKTTTSKASKEADEEEQLKKLVDGQKVLKQRENQYTGMMSASTTVTTNSSGGGASHRFPVGAGGAFGVGVQPAMNGFGVGVGIGTQQNTALSFNFTKNNNNNTTRSSDGGGAPSAMGYQYGFGVGVGFSSTHNASAAGMGGAAATVVGEHTLVDEDNANIVQLDHIPVIKTVEEQVSSELDAMFQDLGQIVADAAADPETDAATKQQQATVSTQQATVPTMVMSNQTAIMNTGATVMMNTTTTASSGPHTRQGSVSGPATAIPNGATIIVDFTDEAAHEVATQSHPGMMVNHPPTMLMDSPPSSANPTVTSEHSNAPLLRAGSGSPPPFLNNNATVIVDMTDSAPESGIPTAPTSNMPTLISDGQTQVQPDQNQSST